LSDAETAQVNSDVVLSDDHCIRYSNSAAPWLILPS